MCFAYYGRRLVWLSKKKKDGEKEQEQEEDSRHNATLMRLVDQTNFFCNDSFSSQESINRIHILP